MIRFGANAHGVLFVGMTDKETIAAYLEEVRAKGDSASLAKALENVVRARAINWNVRSADKLPSQSRLQR